MTPAGHLEFRRESPEDAVALLGELAGNGQGWVNIYPVVDDAPPEARSGLFGIFSGRGPAVPLATYVPSTIGRHREQPASVGIQHGAGPRAVARLSDAGIEVPARWRVRQDHPRRGLVLELPGDEPVGQVLAFLLDAATALSRVRTGESWAAERYGPR